MLDLLPKVSQSGLHLAHKQCDHASAYVRLRKACSGVSQVCIILVDSLFLARLPPVRRQRGSLECKNVGQTPITVALPLWVQLAGRPISIEILRHLHGLICVKRTIKYSGYTEKGPESAALSPANRTYRAPTYDMSVCACRVLTHGSTQVPFVRTAFLMRSFPPFPTLGFSPTCVLHHGTAPAW